jgi:hypothetical protein
MRKHIVMLSTASILCAAQPLFAKSFCDGYQTPRAYVAAKKSVDTEIAAFAQKKPIASQADALLSKLSDAKSPVLISWLKKRGLVEKSEETIVKAWRDYYARNFILTKYPQGDASVDREIEKLVDGILKKHFDKPLQSRLSKLFAQAKKEALATVEAYKFSEKNAILARLKATELYWPKSLKSARNNAIPLDLIDWGIAYDPVPNQINIGLGALSYPNDETYLAVFAHEMGHAFDSCRWGAFFEGKWPFEKVGECLRTTKSAGAKRRDDSRLELIAEQAKISAELVTALKQNPTCNKREYPPIGVQADQLPEAFADWFSAEVVARIAKVDLKRMRLDLCEEKSLNEGSSYPRGADRLERIYFVQPKLRASRGEKPSDELAYCSLESQVAEKDAAPKAESPTPSDSELAIPPLKD